MKPGHERGVVGGDADVADARQRQAGAGRGAVDRRDHGLLERADRADVRVVGRLEVLADVVLEPPELAQVLPGAEALAGAGEHDRADVLVGRLLERRSAARRASRS